MSTRCAPGLGGRDLPQRVPDDRAERLDLAEADLGEALRLEAGGAAARRARPFYIDGDRVELGLVECERALAIDRNLATTHRLDRHGQVLRGPGRGDRGAHPGSAPKSARDAYACAWMVFAAFGKLQQKTRRRPPGRAARSRPPRFMSSYFLLAAARRPRADGGGARAVRAGLALNPFAVVPGSQGLSMQATVPVCSPASRAYFDCVRRRAEVDRRPSLSFGGACGPS